MKAKICIGLLVAVLLGCSSGPARGGAELVSLDAALTSAVADIGSRVTEKTEIVIAGIESPSDAVSEFLSGELGKSLAAGGKFTVLERGRASAVLVSDSDAVGTGKDLGAKVVLTGNFDRYKNFSQFRLRAIDVRTSQILTLYTARIQPDDAALAAVTQSLDNASLAAINESALASLNRGRDLVQEKKYAEAIPELNKALAKNSNLADAYSYRGLAYFLTSNSDRALADWNACLRINPNHADALKNRGTAYFLFHYFGDKSYLDKAIADLSASLKVSPNQTDALNNRATVYATKGDYDRAIADFSAALGIEPDDAGTLYDRGNAYYNKKDYDRAIADYSAALSIKPDDAGTLYNRGNAYYNKKDYDRAIADYEAVLRIDPNKADAKKWLENARKARGR